MCVIGESDVGKSTLCKRYTDGITPDNTTPTIGASFLQTRLTVEGCEIALQIWDTAGQERFRSMAPMYYRHAKAAVCVFDVTNEESFHRVSAWLKDLQQHADPRVVVCIAGNKCDKGASFNLDACKKYADEKNAYFMPTSALTGEGVNELFDLLTKQIVSTFKAEMPARKETDLVKLAREKKDNKKGGCC